MQPRGNQIRCSFVLHIVGKQVISELEDPTCNDIRQWHPKKGGKTNCTILLRYDKFVPTNRTSKKLTTSMAQGIQQWQVQNIQTIKPTLLDAF